MTVFYSTELAGIASLPVVKATSQAYGGRVRRYRATITLAAQATTDTIVTAVIPAGAIFCFGVITSTVTLATATLALGIAGTTGKYRTAAVFTAVDTPTPFGNTTALSMTALAAAEQHFLTIAVAALPGAGTLVVDEYWVQP